jgi:hypothetical protein
MDKAGKNLKKASNPEPRGSQMCVARSFFFQKFRGER